MKLQLTCLQLACNNGIGNIIFPFSFVLAIIPFKLRYLPLMLYNPNCVVQVYVPSQSPGKVMRNSSRVGWVGGEGA